MLGVRISALWSKVIVGEFGIPRDRVPPIRLEGIVNRLMEGLAFLFQLKSSWNERVD